jgi:hypothetical protein
MTDPLTSTAAAGLAAAISGITLALFGVDYYSLVGGCLGASFAVSLASTTMGWFKALSSVLFTALIGAILGSALVSLFGNTQRTVLVALCIVGAAGAQRLVAAAIGMLESKIKGFGEKPL